MKKIKSILALATVFIMTMAGCSGGGSNDSASTDTTAPSQQNESSESVDSNESSDSNKTAKSIGIIQLMDHEALNSARQGFLDYLAENGYKDGENEIIIDYKNAQNDQSNLKAISQQFVNNKVDLILAIATPAAQSVAAETTEIPIVVTAVTDLVDAKLVKSNEKPDTNITGTNDMNPIKEQIQLAKQLVPDMKTLGIMYNSGESNSTLQANMAKEEATSMGIEVIEKTVANQNDVQQVTQSMVGKVDAIYLPTDNVFASSMPIVADITNTNNIPTICGEANMVKAGGLATIGIDYYKLGQQTGQMAVRILNGEDTPQNMPVESLKDMTYTINKETAEQLGIDIPDELKQYLE